MTESKSSTTPHWWKASVGIVVMAILLSFYRVPVPLEQLSSSPGGAPPLLWRMDARTMEQLTQGWQSVRAAYQQWHTTLIDTLRDSHQALHSWTRLCYCTFYPLLRLAYWILTQLFSLTLRLQPHFLRSLSRTGRAFWRWQWSRSPGQVLAQVLVLLWAVGVWVLHRRGVFIRAARRLRHGRDRLVQVGVGAVLVRARLSIFYLFFVYVYTIFPIPAGICIPNRAGAKAQRHMCVRTFLNWFVLLSLSHILSSFITLLSLRNLLYLGAW